MSRRYGVEFEAAKEEYYKEHKDCLGEKLIPHIECSGVMTIHHSKGKEGELLTAKKYFRLLCRGHHNWVHRNKEEAIRLGLTEPN